ncbi:MAG: DUF2778 domain-containing protein [Magnetococcales bacterium]|nr:DUF2778 domain-containing protein [Magnetococcales bacterium]
MLYRKNWLFPDDDLSLPKLADDLEEKGNPVSAKYFRQVEADTNKPYGAEPDPKLVKQSKAHQEAVKHFDTLKERSNTQAELAFEMHKLHRDNDDPAGAARWADENKKHIATERKYDIQPPALDGVGQAFAQAKRTPRDQKNPMYYGTRASEWGFHDRDAGKFYPSPKAFGNHPWTVDHDAPAMDLDPLEDHVSLFQDNDKGNTAFRKRYAQQFGVNLENNAQGENNPLEKQAQAGDDGNPKRPTAATGVSLEPQSAEAGDERKSPPGVPPGKPEPSGNIRPVGSKPPVETQTSSSEAHPTDSTVHDPNRGAQPRVANPLGSPVGEPKGAAAEESRNHSNNAPGGSTPVFDGERRVPGAGPPQGGRNFFEQRFEVGSEAINPSGGSMPPPPDRVKEKYVKPLPPPNWEHLPKDMRESGEKLIYDGRFLSYWKDGRIEKVWRGVSGEEGVQSKEYQSVQNKGPIPHGRYTVAQDQHQSIGVANRLFGNSRVGNFPGGTATWGEHRVWLKPHVENEMHGRKDFTIHGGSEPGSAGCIDLTDEMNSFSEWFKGHKKDIDLEVFYP